MLKIVPHHNRLLLPTESYLSVKNYQGPYFEIRYQRARDEHCEVFFLLVFHPVFLRYRLQACLVAESCGQLSLRFNFNNLLDLSKKFDK